jgi:hypothetical protein
MDTQPNIELRIYMRVFPRMIPSEPVLRFRSRRVGIELRLISERHASLLRVESETNNEALFQTRFGGVVLCCPDLEGYCICIIEDIYIRFFIR